MAKWWVLPEISQNLYERMRRASEKLEVAEDILNTVATLSTMGGSPLAWGLGGLSVIGRAMDMIIPDESPFDYLTGRGYQYYSHCLESNIIQWILASDAPFEIKQTEHAVIRVYDSIGCAMFHTDSPILYTKPGFNVDSVINGQFWKDRDYEIFNSIDGDGSAVVTFRTLPVEIPLYVGDHTIQDVIGRLPPGGKSQAIFFYGPTGSGKSSIARNIARHINPNGKLLRFNTRAVEQWDSTAMAQVIALLKPATILIDDVQIYLDKPGGIDVLIEVMEGLHHAGEEQNFLVLGTMMTTNHTPFRDGMRPGRVDRWVHIGAPSPPTVAAIYNEYITGPVPDHLSEGSIGLTGAYLKEISLRVNAGRWWRQELADVVFTLGWTWCLVIPGYDYYGLGLVAQCMIEFATRGVISVSVLHKRVNNWVIMNMHDDTVAHLVEIYATQPHDKAAQYFDVKNINIPTEDCHPTSMTFDNGGNNPKVDVKINQHMISGIMVKVLTQVMGPGWDADEQCRKALEENGGNGVYSHVILPPALTRRPRKKKATIRAIDPAGRAK